MASRHRDGKRVDGGFPTHVRTPWAGALLPVSGTVWPRAGCPWEVKGKGMCL